MIDIEKGKYWDIGIELVSGCTPCSPGCEHCWSAAMQRRFDSIDMPLTKEDVSFNGFIQTHPERLKRFNTRKPKVFSLWNDLFHEGVPLSFQNSIYHEMTIHNKNTYLVLTKRPHNFSWFKVTGNWKWHTMTHIWHGLTICNQQEADEKIPIFLQVPGKKFLSIEPMLGSVDLTDIGDNKKYGAHGFSCLWQTPLRHRVDAVILGGETGPKARPLNPEWVRSVRDQCAASNTPFFFKGWGEWAPEWLHVSGRPVHRFDSEKPGVMRVGQKKAGRILDGRTHDDLSWRKT